MGSERATIHSRPRSTLMGSAKWRNRSTVRLSRFTRQSTRQLDFSIRPSLSDLVREDHHQHGRQILIQRVYIFAKNRLDYINKELTSVEDVLEERNSQGDNDDFKTRFQECLEPIIQTCNKATLTDDKITGLFLCMNNEYSLLIVEGTEDMVCIFCNELVNIVADHWIANKVFLVDDQMYDTYFKTFLCRSSTAININEKFPPSIITDDQLMGEQHLKLREKLLALCKRLSQESQPQNTQASIDGILSAEEYNKLLPEVQRIDLVLNCTRFYRSLDIYAQTYIYLPMQQDDDAFIWPVPYNYTPADIFKRSPYDVNLTFSDYGQDETKTDEKNKHEDGEEKETAAAAAGADADEKKDEEPETA